MCSDISFWIEFVFFLLQMKLYVFSYVNWSSGYYLLSTICWNPLIFLLGYHWYSSSFCYYVFIPLLCFLLFFFFKFCFFTLQYCVGFAIHQQMPILFKNGYCGIPLMKGCSAHFHNKVSEKHGNYLWNIYCVLTEFCFTQCFPSVYDYRTLPMCSCTLLANFCR